MSNIEKINDFFEHDMNIKKAMMDMAPDQSYLYDEGYIITYFDTAYHDLDYIFDELRTLIKDFNNKDISENTEKKFQQIMEEFIRCGYDGSKLNKFYHDRIADIRPEFIVKMNQTTAGYLLMRDAAFPVRESRTINEMLHTLHSYVVNNDNFYRGNEQVVKAVLSKDCTVTVYGEDNKLAREVFGILSNHEIPQCDEVLVLSVNEDKVLVMTRGLGHATSFEFDRTPEGDIRVSYFIPKICDVDMINNLKGINRIKPLTPIFTGARGLFFTSEDSLYNDFTGLLHGIPGDDDLMRDETRTLRS